MASLWYTVRDFSSTLETVVKETLEDTTQTSRSIPQQEPEDAEDLNRIETGEVFKLRKNNSVLLVESEQVERNFSVGAIYAIHGYLYVGFEGERRQLYIGEYVEFGPRASPCTVTLVGIRSERQEGTFMFKCAN